MLNYLLMKETGHNLVYYNESMKLSISELKVANKKLNNTLENIEVLKIADIDYIKFSKKTVLDENEVSLISKLSFVYALFEMKELDKKLCLIPIAKKKTNFIDTKISSLLKYKGKTNPVFTKMMINVGLLSSDLNYSDRVKLLDPVSGKGTTLYEACVNGFDAYGIEINKKNYHETTVFFKKYLEAEKHKHLVVKGKVNGKTKKDASSFNEFKYTVKKDDFKDKSLHKKFKVICGNSVNASHYFSENTFHLIVGDLPYGIAHGNVKDKKASKSRSPISFLKEALPSWRNVLKENGIIVLAWNNLVFPRKDFINILEENKFRVLDNDEYKEFEHKVDNSIKRDIIVAKKLI